MTLLVAITPLLLVDFHLENSQKYQPHQNARVIFVSDVKNRELFEGTKRHLVPWSVWDDQYFAAKGMQKLLFCNIFITKTTVQMGTIGTTLTLILQVLHYVLQTVAINHCILQHFHELRLPQKTDDLSSSLLQARRLIWQAFHGMLSKDWYMVSLGQNQNFTSRHAFSVSPSRVQNYAKLFGLTISFWNH